MASTVENHQTRDRKATEKPPIHECTCMTARNELSNAPFANKVVACCKARTGQISQRQGIEVQLCCSIPV